MGMMKYAILGGMLMSLCGCYEPQEAPECDRSTIVMVEGTNVIPRLSADSNLRELHLRTVGAERVYQLRVPSSVRDLNLSGNDLPALPRDLVPPTVERLWLADNRLTNLPATFSTVPLTYLNLDRNLLTSLPDMSQMPLRFLRLNGNHLTLLPPLPATIERLYLADNQLTATPLKPSALRHLTLSGNPLTAVPDDLGTGLELLDLRNTKIEKLPDDLRPWRTLKVLFLAGCPLPDAEKDRIEASFDSFDTTVVF